MNEAIEYKLNLRNEILSYRVEFALENLFSKNYLIQDLEDFYSDGIKVCGKKYSFDEIVEIPVKSLEIKLK